MTKEETFDYLVKEVAKKLWGKSKLKKSVKTTWQDNGCML